MSVEKKIRCVCYNKGHGLSFWLVTLFTDRPLPEDRHSLRRTTGLSSRLLCRTGRESGNKRRGHSGADRENRLVRIGSPMEQPLQRVPSHGAMFYGYTQGRRYYLRIFWKPDPQITQQYADHPSREPLGFVPGVCRCKHKTGLGRAWSLCADPLR
jgi:hypothetical protein